jgi:hypothetical protein
LAFAIAEVQPEMHPAMMAHRVHNRVDLDIILAALEELSNRDEQRRLWLSSGVGGADFSSFTEAVETLFSDSGLSVELERDFRDKRGGRPPASHPPIFDKRTDSLFGRLDWLLTKVDNRLPPEELIADPRMEEVREQAVELLAALAPFRHSSA